MRIDSNEIIGRSKQFLLDLAEKLNDIEIKEFQDFVLNAGDFRNLDTFNSTVSVLKNTLPIIYTIELIHEENKNDFLKKFELFYQNNKLKRKNLDRVNHSRYNANSSNILYVGSSMNDFKSRLKDHLGIKKGIRTYGLHLSKWDDNLPYSIRIKTYEISSNTNMEIERTTVEIIEQQIWDTLKPVFGKRSGLL